MALGDDTFRKQKHQNNVDRCARPVGPPEDVSKKKITLEPRPAGRRNTKALLYGTKMIFFGGLGPQDTIYGDMWSIDLQGQKAE